MPGVNAFSAPVFDHTGEIALALTTLSAATEFDSAWNSTIAQELRASAQRCRLDSERSAITTISGAAMVRARRNDSPVLLPEDQAQQLFPGTTLSRLWPGARRQS